MLLFVVTFKDIKLPPPSATEQKISLKLSQFVPPPAPKPVVTPPQEVIQKPLPKKVTKEDIITPTPIPKKKLLDKKKRLVVVKKESKENNITKVVKKKIVKKKIKKTIEKKTKRYKDPLANALFGAGTSLKPRRNRSSGSYGARMIKQLYGKEFNTFTSKQKKFIEKNLAIIHRITQSTLTRNGYPSVAVRTKQEGTNIVTFYLHPNGDISGLRLKKYIGYSALDENTLQVIRFAYKDYPLPKTKTKITFYVTYSIF